MRIRDWINRGVGFGLLLTTIKVKKLWPYFIVGYICAAFLGINMLGIGLIAVAAVFLYQIFTGNRSGAETPTGSV